MKTGHLEHLYYGRKIRLPQNELAEALIEKQAFAPGNTNVYTDEQKNFTLEDIRLEMSGLGRGDIREPFVEVVHADGSFTSDFVYAGATIEKGKPQYETLPGAYDENDEVDYLCVTLQDKLYGVTLLLNYYVFEDCDVICRSAKLINNSEEIINVQRLMSMQLDFDTADYVFTTFNGAWAREMKRHDIRVNMGKHVNSSYTGTSSNRSNPFVMLSKEETTEDFDECYGFNLVYSGNHYEAVEVSSTGKTRVVTGINPQSFTYVLEPGESL